ncbi:MAG TPA: helix-turn-helix domain-containing protein, partial [Solirubrobacteraceae bacterium]|nr:helix-turn-helix domain-containing protein [Solirubrobacteraceae bacterium]
MRRTQITEAVGTVDLLSIGEFARRSRLSPKALRLYDELGLLAPARVDEDSGYRYYAEAQLDRAQLIAALRELQISLADINTILSCDREAVADRIARHWASVESQHAARRDLAGYLIDRFQGKRHHMYEVTTRAIPARSVLCLKRNVDGSDGAWAFGKEFISILREHPLPRIEGRAGAVFSIYWGEVSDDSDGPVEWCRPLPGDQADEIAAAIPELTLRIEPAHREAFIHLGPGPTEPAVWQLVSQSMRGWADENAVQASELGTRITYLWDPARPEGQGPD